MGQLISFLFPFAILIGVFYFILIRPQQKEKKRLADLLSSLKVGDQITTVGGIIGRVEDINETKDIILITTGQAKIQVKKEAISGVVIED